MILSSDAKDLYIYDHHFRVKVPIVVLALFLTPFAYAAHEFNKAADLYTQALDHNPFDPILWCNRAYARIGLEEHGYALNDAGTASILYGVFAPCNHQRWL